VFGLLRAAGDGWCCVLELNQWRRRRQDVPLAGYQELGRELAAAGPGTFGELGSTGARSVLRRYSDAWFAAAGRRKDGGRVRAVSAPQAGPGPGPLVRGHVRPRRAGAEDPGRAGLPAAAGPPGPRHPLSAGAGAVGDAGIRCGPAVCGRDR
jgi:hypothetical protein